jgi:hypothetical protein
MFQLFKLYIIHVTACVKWHTIKNYKSMQFVFYIICEISQNYIFDLNFKFCVWINNGGRSAWSKQKYLKNLLTNKGCVRRDT